MTSIWKFLYQLEEVAGPKFCQEFLATFGGKRIQVPTLEMWEKALKQDDEMFRRNQFGISISQLQREYGIGYYAASDSIDRGRKRNEPAQN